MQTSSPIQLDLKSLPLHTDLTPPMAETHAAAASVVLEVLHGQAETSAAIILINGSEQPALITSVPVDERTHRTHGDFQEATEHGAAGIGMLAAKLVLNRVVFG